MIYHKRERKYVRMLFVVVVVVVVVVNDISIISFPSMDILYIRMDFPSRLLIAFLLE